MAMLGSKDRIVSDMNVTPMIDVLLVLIIVFMVINTATRTTGLEAVIPKPPAAADEKGDGRAVVVQVLDTGDRGAVLKINGETASWDSLPSRLIEIYKTRAERVLFVKADSQVEFENVARVIDVAHGTFADMRIGFYMDAYAGAAEP